MKAVIPAAGFGTRFLPIAKAVPKEMLPLGDRPVIHYVVEEAVANGCDDILIVISRGKESIQHYFSPHPELERQLEARGRMEELERLRAVSRLATIHYVHQPEMRGLGDAMRWARPFVGNEPFAVLLGDTVVHGPSALASMLAVALEHCACAVALEPCPPERVSRYGVAGGREVAPGVFELNAMIEKPAPADVPVLHDPSGAVLPPHAFAARYVFQPEIFDALEGTAPGKNGEIQLTDAMRTLLGDGGFYGCTFAGRRLDIGNPRGLIEAAQLLGS
jgi:UTP--glucose-1-phosphate uridylyltransferase